MQSLARSMLSSGPGVRRISRWHPYHQGPATTPASGSSTSSEGSNHAPLFLSSRCTVSSSVYAPSPLALNSSQTDTPVLVDSEHALVLPTPPSKVLTAEDRATYATCLIDRAVNILTQCWTPVSYCPFPQVLSFAKDARPVTPCSSSASVASVAPPLAAADSAGPRYPYQSTAEHMPLRQFMHEVLRRSRTSCTSLQTALCYVEAVASKLPELVQQELRRIDQQNVASIIDDCAVVDSTVTVAGVTDDSPPEVDAQPALPSPLLCPRRTFLASLLLASKFLQDRSYSNKAWGKLTGLAPREVGRCERALSEALEWRLWVGKGQGSPFPSDFMDDGGPVIPPDAVYTPDAASQPSTAALATTATALPSTSMASTSAAASRPRRLQTDPAVMPSRSTRRLGPAATWAPSRFACSTRAAGLLGATARTATWVHGLPPTLPALPHGLVGSPADIAFAATHGGDAITNDNTSTPSLSPPGSLLYTQSSAASFASFPDLSTPPDAFADASANLALAGMEKTIDTQKLAGPGFACADPQLLNIASAGDWNF